MDYRQSGVDIDAGNETVRRIKSLARSTFTRGVLSEIGSFGGLFHLDRSRFDDPVLVSSADGVGTKLKVVNGYPGSAEVVNMQPPAALMKKGIMTLPTMGDGRQSGTSGSPSILNVSPEAAVGGTIGLVQEGDSITVDANQLLIQLNVDAAELARRRQAWVAPEPRYRTGVLGKYARLVSSSSKGAVTDPVD